MLIGHDAIEPDFIGQGVLLMVLIVQHVRPLGIEIGVGEIQPPRRVFGQILVGHVAIGLFRKPEYLDLFLHASLLLFRDILLRNGPQAQKALPSPLCLKVARIDSIIC